MNSEYGQSSSRENSIEQRKSMEELKRMNQPNSAPANTPSQTVQPIVIRCDLPQAMNKLTEQADGINWELAEMNKLLERVGNLSEEYSSKWIDWLPDFSLLVALKWIMLVLILGTAALAGWCGAAAIRGLFL